MKSSVVICQLMGFGVTSFLGTVLHFMYEWLDGAVWIAPFSGVNESTWEHMKLLFWSMLIYAVIESFLLHEQENFWCVKLRGIILGLSLIPILFYTYNGVIGKSPDFVNIAIFFIAAAAAYLYEARLFIKNNTSCHSPKIAITLLSIIAFLFILFTFRTPTIDIFKDPITGAYGIK